MADLVGHIHVIHTKYSEGHQARNSPLHFISCILVFREIIFLHTSITWKISKLQCCEKEWPYEIKEKIYQPLHWQDLLYVKGNYGSFLSTCEIKKSLTVKSLLEAPHHIYSSGKLVFFCLTISLTRGTSNRVLRQYGCIHSQGGRLVLLPRWKGGIVFISTEPWTLQLVKP